jgi:EpsD family peptidyl-prolyl cis-trans isomerase
MSASTATPRFCLTVLIAAATTLLAAGCSNKDPQTAVILAKVDGEEINLRQVNAQLAKAEGITQDNISEAKLEILGSLVEQQLAVNLALSNKLDRKAEIVNAIEASRRKILAQAAMDQITADLPVVGEEEAKRYFAEHPALYSERRIFTVQELTIKKPAAGVEQIRTQIAAAKRLEDVAAWLKDKKVAFISSAGTRAAEQIAPEILPKLQIFKDGQMGLLESHNAFTVIRLVSSIEQPIGSAKAIALIQTMLGSQRASEAVKQAKLDMRSSAKLEYFGEFAGAEAAFKAGTKLSAKNAVADDEAQIKARAKAEATIVEQGIKGL